MDVRLRGLRWFGMWRHKKVLKELKKIWLREKDFELRAAAAEGLANQVPFANDAGKAIVKGLVSMEKLASRDEPEGEEAMLQVLEAKALVAGIKALADLEYAKAWKETKGFIEHPDDDVAGAMMTRAVASRSTAPSPSSSSGSTTTRTACSWAGGSVRVDTGAAGNKDQRTRPRRSGRRSTAAAPKKARPAAWEKMIEALEMITGEKFEKSEELKEWMKENKVLLRKHGV